MKNFKWITGVSILLFLVASATPAFSAKPWPQGGEKGPVVDPDFKSLDPDHACDVNLEVQSAEDAYGNVKQSIEETLEYIVHKNVKIYPLPPTYDNDEGETVYTTFKEQASLAWSNYHGKMALQKGDVADALIIAEQNRDNFENENYEVYVCTQEDVDSLKDGCTEAGDRIVGELLDAEEELRTFYNNSDDQINSVRGHYEDIVTCLGLIPVP